MSKYNLTINKMSAVGDLIVAKNIEGPFKFQNLKSLDNSKDTRDDIVLLPVEQAALGGNIQLLPGPGGGAIALPQGYAIVLQRLT